MSFECLCLWHPLGVMLGYEILCLDLEDELVFSSNCFSMVVPSSCIPVGQVYVCHCPSGFLVSRHILR